MKKIEKTIKDFKFNLNVVDYYKLDYYERKKYIKNAKNINKIHKKLSKKLNIQSCIEYKIPELLNNYEKIYTCDRCWKKIIYAKKDIKEAEKSGYFYERILFKSNIAPYKIDVDAIQCPYCGKLNEI